MLETTECIPIKNHSREYTDCMEFSLLRFLHIIFYSESQMKSQGYSTYVLNPESTALQPHPDLLAWIERFPRIYREASYYQDGAGVLEREAWAQFVSDRPYFEYYRTDGAELFTNVRNIAIFCKELLGMVELDLEDTPDEDLIQVIGKRIADYTGKEIKIYIGDKEGYIEYLTVEEIREFLSKPRSDIDTLQNPDYGVVSRRTILHLTVDGGTYSWNLYEVFFKKRVLFNPFITGHSVLVSTPPLEL